MRRTSRRRPTGASRASSPERACARPAAPMPRSAGRWPRSPPTAAARSNPRRSTTARCRARSRTPARWLPSSTTGSPAPDRSRLTAGSSPAPSTGLIGQAGVHPCPHPDAVMPKASCGSGHGAARAKYQPCAVSHPPARSRSACVHARRRDVQGPARPRRTAAGQRRRCPGRRLGLDPDADPAQLREATLAALAAWQRRAESPISDRTQLGMARTLVRTCGGLLASLPR